MKDKKLQQAKDSEDTSIVPDIVAKYAAILMSSKKVHVSVGRKAGRLWARQIANAKHINTKTK